MTSPSPDPVTAYLVEVGERGYRKGATGRECNRLSDAAADDIPRLVAAVWKALGRHEPTVHRRLPVCRWCEEAWPCNAVREVNSALLGETGV